MNSMIITNNSLTATRIRVIATRTSSDLMAGAKAMMIESLKKALATGIAHFVYLKKDGTLREAWGTTNANLIASRNYVNGRGCSRENYATTAYLDLQCGEDGEVAAWRSFRWETLIKVF